LKAGDEGPAEAVFLLLDDAGAVGFGGGDGDRIGVAGDDQRFVTKAEMIQNTAKPWKELLEVGALVERRDDDRDVKRGVRLGRSDTGFDLRGFLRT